MKNRAVLWVIVSLLVFNVLSAGYGFYLHMDSILNPPPDNPNKEFKYNNKLYFYGENGELISTYQCKNDYCGYAKNTIDDSQYNTNYYKGAVQSEIPLINYRYAFLVDDPIQDSENVILYDVVNQKEVRKLTGVKNYSIGINNQYMIVRDENVKWGVMKMNSNAGIIIDFKYDFLGLNSRVDSETGMLKSDSFIAFDNNGWKIISDSEADKSTYFFNAINDFYEDYIITSNSGTYFLNDAKGNVITTEESKGMIFVGGFLKMHDSSNQCYLMNLDSLEPASKKYNVEYMDDLDTQETLNGVEIYYNGELQETILR